MLVVRVGFVLLSASMGVGVVVYLVLWLALPLAAATPDAPGIDAATRGGLRTAQQRHRVPADLGAMSAVVLLGAGLLWFVQSAGCLLYTSPSPRDGLLSRMPSSA